MARKPQANKPLINDNIQSPLVLLIDQDGTNHGKTQTREAIGIAKDAGLDLVVVSEGRTTPVAKILDYGKHLYQQKKRQRQSNGSRTSMKEVKLRPNVGDSDYGIRIDRATEWLNKGDSVKFQVRLRGREHQHRDRARDLLERVISDLKGVGKVQAFDRRALVVQVIPS
ncbi:MAG: translation initiation factor IF-3 [Cyanobacteria bacterium P01_A01_bin.135]